MKECPKCNKQHQKNGMFCSRACANSRVWNKSDKTKKSLSAKKAYENMSDEQKKQIQTRLTVARHKLTERSLVFLMQEDFDNLAYQSKRIRVILEQNNKCNKCGLSEWMGQPITFELDHKDGNRENNIRSNLEILCPNCHSMTETWCGRKNGTRRKRLERLLEQRGCGEIGEPHQT